MYKILLTVLIFATIGLMSCDNGSIEQEEANPFVGTWEAASGEIQTFTENQAARFYPNGDAYWYGTYTYTETHIYVELKWEPQEYAGYPISTTPFLYHFEENGDLTLNSTVFVKQ